jgi:hypothetical protein
MKGSWLISFWIVTPYSHAPLGFGVTSFTLEEAIKTIIAEGYGDYLPDDLGQLQVIENVTINDLDQWHVVPNMGPMVMRGLWYPCWNIGWPHIYRSGQTP